VTYFFTSGLSLTPDSKIC